MVFSVFSPCPLHRVAVVRDNGNGLHYPISFVEILSLLGIVVFFMPQTGMFHETIIRKCKSTFFFLFLDKEQRICLDKEQQRLSFVLQTCNIF